MPAKIRQEIERVRAEIARLTEYVAALEKAEEAAEGRLTPSGAIRTVSSVHVEPRKKLSSNTKRGATRATRKSEPQRLLYEQDMTISALAEELGETRSLVSKWFAGAGEENRAIPRHVAERLKRDYDIPLSAWARIGD